MREDVFRRRLADKSDEELEYIIDNQEKYVIEAVIVATEILEERTKELIENSTYPKRIASLEALEDHLDITTFPKPKKTRPSFVTENPNDPELYTQKMVIVFTLLFGIIFGAALMMYNISKTNNQKKSWHVLIFAMLYTILVITIFYYLIGGNIGILMTLFSNLIAVVIIAGIFWNKYIGREFEHRPKNWVFAAIVSILIYSPLVVLLIMNR